METKKRIESKGKFMCNESREIEKKLGYTLRFLSVSDIEDPTYARRFAAIFNVVMSKSADWVDTRERLKYVAWLVLYIVFSTLHMLYSANYFIATSSNINRGAIGGGFVLAFLLVVCVYQVYSVHEADELQPKIVRGRDLVYTSYRVWIPLFYVVVLSCPILGEFSAENLLYAGLFALLVLGLIALLVPKSWTIIYVLVAICIILFGFEGERLFYVGGCVHLLLVLGYLFIPKTWNTTYVVGSMPVNISMQIGLSYMGMLLGLGLGFVLFGRNFQTVAYVLYILAVPICLKSLLLSAVLSVEKVGLIIESSHCKTRVGIVQSILEGYYGGAVGLAMEKRGRLERGESAVDLSMLKTSLAKYNSTLGLGLLYEDIEGLASSIVDLDIVETMLVDAGIVETPKNDPNPQKEKVRVEILNKGQTGELLRILAELRGYGDCIILQTYVEKVSEKVERGLDTKYYYLTKVLPLLLEGLKQNREQSEINEVVEKLLARLRIEEEVGLRMQKAEDDAEWETLKMYIK